MNSDGKQKLFAVIEKIGKICSREMSSEGDKAGVLASFRLMSLMCEAQEIHRIRMTDLSRYLMISKPAATQAMDRLVKLGLVERVNDENDRRVVYVQPTEEGKKQFKEEMERRLGFIDRVVERMGANDAEQLAVLLDRFFSAAEAETEGK